MKLCRYGDRGSEKPGLIDAQGRLRDLSGHVADISGPVLADLSALRGVDPSSLPLVPGNPRMGAAVAGVGKFICIGLNYSDHAAESGMAVPPEPVIFAKYTSAICGPNDPIIIPRGSVKTDWEVELAFVIGKPGKYIAEADAMDHVAG
jgi:2-keto-4-pentenoate hydratase/2-oxohepta-3-ene-1,7-dioic acid hydratase in catechol pathway